MIRTVRRMSERQSDTPLREGRTQAERRDEAERRILEAAADIVAEGGFEAITLALAGERAGYSRGLPSHYFRTKDDLLSALGVYVVESFITRRRASAGAATGFEGLIGSIRYYFQMPPERPNMVRAFHAVLAGALNTPAIAATVAKLNQDSAAEISAGLRAGVAAGQLRDDIDPDLEGRLILATLRGSVAQWLADPERIDLTRLGAHFIASLERSLAK
ncbi:TetR/AcrR family transcriptional regulator [Bradyrhizobium sp. NAS96.2]|uniref:TetR/AcrR family transcriptional regulator n=1 Tax=Bradyrhizobium sp. NAS96.2 TaxID=1680160 RepID=UPI000A782469|nr:TetR/AcrR family transcriptional regulator [Bradyrhizobium sp. NAS96.2]